jgi:hypothetical protein
MRKYIHHSNKTQMQGLETLTGRGYQMGVGMKSFEISLFPVLASQLNKYSKNDNL